MIGVVFEAAGFDEGDKFPAEVGFAGLGEFEGDYLAGLGFFQEAGQGLADASGVDHYSSRLPEVGQGFYLGVEVPVFDAGPLLAVDDAVDGGVDEGVTEGG